MSGQHGGSQQGGDHHGGDHHGRADMGVADNGGGQFENGQHGGGLGRCGLDRRRRMKIQQYRAHIFPVIEALVRRLLRSAHGQKLSVSTNSNRKNWSSDSDLLRKVNVSR